MKKISLFLFALLMGGSTLVAQEMSFESYNPPSTLKVPQHPVTRSKFPFIDIHSHQGGVNKSKIDQLSAEMKELNMAIMINLSGRGFGQGNSNAQQEYIKGMMQE